MKPVRLLVQVRGIQAVVDRNGTVTERLLLLELLNTRHDAEAADRMAQRGNFGGPGYEGLMGAMGPNPGNLRISMSAAESHTVKAGDWLKLSCEQLSDAEQNELALVLGERTELYKQAERASAADSEEAKEQNRKQLAILEKIASCPAHSGTTDL